MSSGQRKLWASWLGLHFFFIVVASLQDLASILPGERTFLSLKSEAFWRRVGSFSSLVLGNQLSPSNPLRQAIATYTNSSGIELGYSYFAPSVPENPKLIFELRLPDGDVNYDLPHVGSAASGYRIAALLDNLQHVSYRPLREAIVQNLAYRTRLDHPDAVTMRAFFTTSKLPSPAEFRAGQRPFYRLLYTYEIRLRPTDAP